MWWPIEREIHLRFEGKVSFVWRNLIPQIIQGSIWRCRSTSIRILSAFRKLTDFVSLRNAWENGVPTDEGLLPLHGSEWAGKKWRTAWISMLPFLPEIASAMTEAEDASATRVSSLRFLPMSPFLLLEIYPSGNIFCNMKFLISFRVSFFCWWKVMRLSRLSI